ncbi:MAG: type 4a pilus biogenesis protein PilO [Deltaproteobacteria bacterium]|nr:type 4a pilus biogenesis protein PilO [Deltaproteobacteria bacterium]
MHLEIKTLDRICLITVVVVFFLSGSLVVSRGMRQLRELRQQNEFLSGGLKDLALAETNLQRVNAAIAETRQQMKALNERIPDSTEVGEFLKQLNILMTERRVVLESFKPLPIVEEKRFTRIPIRLVSTGTFTNIYKLLCDLETMNRFVDVGKAKIAKLDNGPGCQLDITTSIFER